MAAGLAAICLCALALSSCELPPDEAWRIVRRDGLITYATREHNPKFAPTRYLSSPSPGLPRGQRTAHATYKTGADATGSRYLAVPAPPHINRPLYRSEREHPAPRYHSPSGLPARASRPREAETTTRIITAPPAATAGPMAQPSSPPVRSPAPIPDSLPYGTPVPGRPGMVNSPFADKKQLVDVTGMATGETVRDPYSGKLFRVPPVPQSTPPPEKPAKSEETEKTAP